jgi:NhaC family Na+:H+ antiporter
MVGLMFTILKLDKGPHIPILAAAVVGGLVAIFGLGFTWKEIEEGIVDTIKMSMSATLILMVIGMIIGTWILSGIVPVMIYWGLKILSPSIFLLATCVICSIVSMCTGSSWTTAGTVGVALVGVGASLGMPLGMVGGAIISGSYFGDKMSPLSDTTNLAPAMAGSELFEHIKHMVFTTGPSYCIALLLYGLIGIKYAGKALDTQGIDIILAGLESSFNLTPFLFLVPIILIIMIMKKTPATPALLAGTFLGGLFAWIFQKASMADIVEAMYGGFVLNSGNEALDNLLSRGGMGSMMNTVALILIAMTFGGVMMKSGMLGAVANAILKVATTTGNLVLATVATVLTMNIFTGDQYLSIVVPGRMYKDIFAKKRLKAKNLSRILEDSGTLTSSLVPWNTGGIYMASTLGVATLAYAPFAFLNLLNPLVSILYGYTGFTMEKMDPEEVENNKKEEIETDKTNTEAK